jgi:2-dehydropantoate 2-reductase
MSLASVLVMGAGAVGSYYGALLARAGHDVRLICRGSHLDAMTRSGGISVAESDGTLWHQALSTMRRPAPPAPDLALITTKSPDTLAAAEALATIIDDRTIVLSLQNGVENVGRAERVLGVGRVLAGQAFVGVWIDEPGTVVHGAEGRVSIGDPLGGVTERAARAHGLLVEAWDVALAEDIVFDQWKKLLWNAGFNALCAITGCTAGQALAEPSGAATVRGAMREVVAIARHHGISLSERDVEEMAADNPQLRDYRPSTARDLDAGKAVESDALCGFVSREGARLGVPTPVNEALDALLGLRQAAS